MKKILIFILFIFISIDLTYACKTQILGKEIPKEFKENCYEQIGKLNIITPSPDTFQCLGRVTYKINSNKKIDTFISENEIIPHKLYKNSGKAINYETNLEGNINYLIDDNYKTYLLIDTSINNEIKIEFDKKIKSNSFDFIFKYSVDNFYTEFAISDDGNNYKLVTKENIKDYDIKNLKIFFEPKTKKIKHEKIEITELAFISINYKYLIKTKGNIKAFSKNICKNNYVNLKNNISEYSINKDTKTLNIELNKNTKFDIFKIEDSDNDGVENNIDNCKTIYNPIQKDINGNGIGDLCSDDDKDGIIGNKDNCVYIYNPRQTDINRNFVGDKCEFDKDNDGIFDENDNCINTSNSDQKDTDKDGIGNTCDNSIYYNPRQIDKNNNGIGDVTEEKEKKLKENDIDDDGIIDYKDNCKNIANPNQKDSDNDGVGNICDNCINIQNTNQLDFNMNGIGDICEDSDKDGIDGLIDNCINIANSDQKDSDNDGVGNACEDDDSDKILASNDNCPFIYNPDQSDIDKDGIGDNCDEKDNRYIESNSTFFIGLLIFIILIFGGGIFLMIRKLK